MVSHLIGKLYQFYEGGWLKVYYYNGNQFLIEVLNRWLIELKCLEPSLLYKMAVESSALEMDAKLSHGTVSLKN